MCGVLASLTHVPSGSLGAKEPLTPETPSGCVILHSYYCVESPQCSAAGLWETSCALGRELMPLKEAQQCVSVTGWNTSAVLHTPFRAAVYLHSERARARVPCPRFLCGWEVAKQRDVLDVKISRSWRKLRLVSFLLLVLPEPYENN